MVISYDWGSKGEVDGGRGREYMASGWERGVDSILPRDLRLETVTLRPNFLVNFYKMPCSFSLLSQTLSFHLPPISKVRTATADEKLVKNFLNYENYAK